MSLAYNSCHFNIAVFVHHTSTSNSRLVVINFSPVIYEISDFQIEILRTNYFAAQIRGFFFWYHFGVTVTCSGATFR